MRRLLVSICAAMVLALTGCTNWLQRMNNNGNNNAPITEAPPRVEELLGYLNDCSHRLTSVESTGISMDARQGNQSGSVTADMVCAKPRNFRLVGRAFGATACDIGSNSDEFWYWIKSDNPPYLYHCNYDALARGNVPLPFPFQPDMVVAALGMRDYDPDASKYDLKVLPRTLELSEKVISTQGQPVQLVTVFNRERVTYKDGRPQVFEYALKDNQGRDLCKATIERVQVAGPTGAVVPQKVKLSWPAQKIELTLTLNAPKVNQTDPRANVAMFRRDNLSYPSFDLARGALDGSGTSIQRVRGSLR